jgi:Zinc carboxypeptidase
LVCRSNGVAGAACKRARPSTFTPANRLWRKNLRDNNGDGQISNVDGVDPNRNFPTHWGYDGEGSSPNPVSETYRGTRPRVGARDARSTA